jgi:maltose alpha-D-glucosyltransferase/alpha-amylase
MSTREEVDGKGAPRPYPEWLEKAVIYNIYPPSFMDSNGDGIGDLPGITSRLKYLHWLGVDTLWLNPINDSPFRDGGYDIRDYYAIAPRYGTMDDLESLIGAAKSLGMRILMDLVPGHTSDEHPWFRESARAERNPYSDRYVWADGVMGDAAGSGAFIGGLCGRDARYLPNFFPFQPALNYGYAKPQAPWQLPVDHPSARRMRDEMTAIMRRYLSMGIAGYRVDMASSLIKGDPGHVETRRLWQGIRAGIQADYPEAVLLSEWSCPREAIAAGFHIDFYIQFNVTGYNLLFRAESGRSASADRGPSWFDAGGRGDVRTFAREFGEHYAETLGRGFISVPSGNHDVPRVSEGRSDAELKALFAFLLTLPGVPQLYYGDEIGMRNVKGLPSKEGGYARTQARTPMSWDDGPNAGFSTAPAHRIYLPLGPENPGRNVKVQQADPQSLLNFVRGMIAFRRMHPALDNTGFFQPLMPRRGSYPFAYLRSADDETLLVVVNPAGEGRTADFDIPLFPGAGACLAGTPCAIEQRGEIIRIEAPPASTTVYGITAGR